MRVVAGVLVVAVNSLLVEATWVGGAPAVRLARLVSSWRVFTNIVLAISLLLCLQFITLKYSYLSNII